MTTQHARRSPEPPTCDDKPIWDIWLSTFRFPALTVADELGVFPLLAEAPCTAAEIGARLSIGPRATEALMAIVVSLGCAVRHEDRFYLTDVARNFLLPASPFYWGGVLRAFKHILITHDALMDAIRREQAPAPAAGEAPADRWDTHELSLEHATGFTRAMHSHSFPAAVGVARRGDFTGARRLLDVGGGSGCYCIALAMRYPEMRFTVAELPVVARLAAEYVAEYDLHDRIEVAPLNMFRDAFPEGHDAILFSNVLHDWSRARCGELLRRAFDALPSGGRLYVHEMLLNDTADGPLTAAAFTMAMLFSTEGKQFRAAELRELIEERGFTDVSINPSYGYFSLITAGKP